MSKWKAVFLCVVIISFSNARADEPPPFQADPISLDRASPSVIGFGNTPGDIYGEVPAGAIGGGWDLGGPGPVMHVPEGTYGLLPGENNDGHSNGEQTASQFVLYFSGSDSSVGMPGTNYEHQAIRGQAAGDRFVMNGFTTTALATVVTGGGPSGTSGAMLPGPINLLSANQTRYNEIPSIAPPAFNTYVPPPGATIMDDMDALEITPIDVDGDLVHETPIYFSLDAIGPSGAAPADIYLAPPGVAALVFAPAASLGLGPLDDVDALAVWDGDLSLTTPLTDFAIFSLAPGSAFLAGLDGSFGTPDDYSAADIFVTDFTGTSALFLPASSLGMLFTDNVDALDVEVWSGASSIEIFDVVPEPSTALLLGVGLMGLAARRRR